MKSVDDPVNMADRRHGDLSLSLVPSISGWNEAPSGRHGCESPSVLLIHLPPSASLSPGLFAGQSGDQRHGVPVAPGAPAGPRGPRLLQPCGAAGLHGPAVVQK